jgi:hypothetical protein
VTGKTGETARESTWGPLDGVKTAGARTPEELETLFEDALVVRHHESVAGLFEAGALLVVGDGPPVRGGEAIARLAMAIWDGERTYVADPRRVVQARDLALIVADQGITVARRGSDGAWRYAISLLSHDNMTAMEEK